MKRIGMIVLSLLFLAGCTPENQLDSALQLRQKLLNSNGCTFAATITADYGQIIHTFSLECEADAEGAVSFCVAAPQTIAGITGSLEAEGGKLTFDDHILAFELMADGRLSPISAPWLLIHTLRSGYIHSYTQTEQGMRMMIHDSYREDALQLDITVNPEQIPVSAEIFWQGNRIMTITIENFTYL